LTDTKKSKYDTNPLDPEVERKAEESFGDGGAPTQPVGGATRDVGRTPNENARQNIYSEAPTRRYDNPSRETSYPSVFVPPTYSPPTHYQQPAPNAYYSPVTNQPTSRPVPGLGISEKWAAILPYAPWVGIIAALVDLFLAPRREARVRFHASQALALHIAILIIRTILGVVGSITDSHLGTLLFSTAATVFLVISMIRVWRGEPHRIAPLAEPAQWFNEHIEPRTQG
jgi:uncharacterized membrane protein